MYIFGASGHGKVVKSVIEASGQKLKAFVDDAENSAGIHMGIPVIHSSVLSDDDSEEFIIAIGDNRLRKAVSERLNSKFIKAIHPSSIVDDTVLIGAGTVVMPHVVINPDAVIGDHVIVNSGAVVEHDCKLADYVHISPNATLAGGVAIGEGTQIGAGAIVLPGVIVGKWCMVGAGAVVSKSLPDYCTAVGIPAKPIKFHGQ